MKIVFRLKEYANMGTKLIGVIEPSAPLQHLPQQKDIIVQDKTQYMVLRVTHNYDDRTIYVDAVREDHCSV
jgi:hypothetical protein